jgi:hypothetical protein
MIATSHVIIGGAAGIAVGAITQNPFAALLAGIVSHLLCDSLPHIDYPPNSKFINDEIVWDKPLYIFAITDSLIAFFSILFLWIFKFDFNFFSVFAWGALGGYLPDFIDNFPLWRDRIHITPLLAQFHKFHLWIHHNWEGRFPPWKHWKLGIATQVVTVLPCLWYILK